MQKHSKVTRRDFLRRGAAASAAGFAVPYLIPSGVLAADGQPGANDRIGIAGIGIGRQGEGVLRGALGFKECRFIGIADVMLPRAEGMCKRLGGEAYQDYRRLLDRKDVDAIVTATPDHWRALVTIHACQAGKDVYAEKALSLTIREGRLMVEAARKYQRVFQVGSQQRSQAVNRLSCEYVRSGKLGKIKEIVGCNYPSPWECALPAESVPDGLDWDMWCGPAPLVPYNKDLFTPRANPGWLSFRPYSGGEMTGWGAHGIDQIQWALGMDDSGPVEVWTEGDKFNPPTYTAPESRARGDKICQVPMIYYRYADGVVVKLDNGSGGGGIFFGENGKMDLSRGLVRTNPPEIAEEINKQAKGADQNHVGNWIECMKSRAKPVADVEIGHRSITVCHLGNIARWAGRKLRWDPVKEVFPDDADANQYLDRQRRKPYELPETI
ncbi:MAG: Gfo/Idh/MocA family oxidoreductase [Pirellulaceae bacterium]|jgi:predicted dehydrogenase|nr:Gfo/Idh/MocA family oxidoreductase [Pirellulaceae bacterium]